MIDEHVLRIEQLVGLYGKFIDERQESKEDWKSAFANWMVDQKSTNIDGDHLGMGQDETFIGMFLIALSNLTRNRVNKLINNSPFSTIMDYQFLLVLEQHGKMKKSELISINYMEMSSGIEVIKRLLKQKWIYEEENPDDKRSKLVAISSIGGDILIEYQGKVNHLYNSFSSLLTPVEKNNVLHSLELLTKNNSGN